MAVALAVLAAIALLGLVRIGLEAEYGGDGAFVRARVGPATIRIYPRREGKKEAGKEKREKPGKQEERPRHGAVREFKRYLTPAASALKRLRRRLTVDELELDYLAASPDPFETAVSFGAASAGCGVLLAVLENLFKIKRRSVRTSFDFKSTEPRVYVKVRVSLAVWEAAYVALRLFADLAAAKGRRQAHAGKAV